MNNVGYRVMLVVEQVEAHIPDGETKSEVKPVPDGFRAVAGHLFKIDTWETGREVVESHMAQALETIHEEYMKRKAEEEKELEG